MNTYTRHCSKWFDIRNPWRIDVGPIGIRVRYDLRIARDNQGVETPLSWEITHAEWSRREIAHQGWTDDDYPDTERHWSILEPILADELQELHGITADGAPVYDTSGARLIPFYNTLPIKREL